MSDVWISSAWKSRSKTAYPSNNLTDCYIDMQKQQELAMLQSDEVMNRLCMS